MRLPVGLTSKLLLYKCIYVCNQTYSVCTKISRDWNIGDICLAAMLVLKSDSCATKSSTNGNNNKATFSYNYEPVYSSFVKQYMQFCSFQASWNQVLMCGSDLQYIHSKVDWTLGVIIYFLPKNFSRGTVDVKILDLPNWKHSPTQLTRPTVLFWTCYTKSLHKEVIALGSLWLVLYFSRIHLNVIRTTIAIWTPLRMVFHIIISIETT